MGRAEPVDNVIRRVSGAKSLPLIVPVTWDFGHICRGISRWKMEIFLLLTVSERHLFLALKVCTEKSTSMEHTGHRE